MTSPAISPAPLARVINAREAVLPLSILLVLVVMLVPLPTFLLDLFLALNLGASVLLLLITLSTRQALELSVFPSLLLILTLFRLSLNVATTRLILLNGDAGHIVRAFGNMVVGGQLVVGLVVFLILVVIQFMVITKGAGRISEVAARFTLDALPGKQMSIDAELNSGAIDEAQAKQRRVDLARETEFYGAMDGASKFVRGDAVAGLLITAVNLVGGVLIGVLDGMPLVEAVATYSVLTVGDGLVSQIPALIIATAAGLLTTKASSGVTLDSEIIGQLLMNDRLLYLASGTIGALALIPGLPKLPFLAVAGGLLLIPRQDAGSRSEHPASQTGGKDTFPSPAAENPSSTSDHLDDFLMSDRSMIEVGAKLVPFVESKRFKGLADRISTLRRDLSRIDGIWVPQIRIRSQLQLDPEEYRIVISGRRVASATLRTSNVLAIPPEGKPLSLPGEVTQEPAFGLQAVWIHPDLTKKAEQSGYTVVEPLNVLITHLGECLKRHSHELLTRESLKMMLDRVREFAPAVVDDLRPDVIRMGTLHQVLVQLAEERFPLADMALILETVVYHAPGAKSAEEIVDRVRVTLGRLACDRYRSTSGEIRVLVLEPKLESRLREHLIDGQLALPPTVLQKLLAVVGSVYQAATRQQHTLAVLCDAQLRRPLRRLLARSTSDLGVLAFQEIPTDLSIDPSRIVRADEIFSDPQRPKEHPPQPAVSTHLMRRPEMAGT